MGARGGRVGRASLCVCVGERKVFKLKFEAVKQFCRIYGWGKGFLFIDLVCGVVGSLPLKIPTLPQQKKKIHERGENCYRVLYPTVALSYISVPFYNRLSGSLRVGYSTVSRISRYLDQRDVQWH